MGMWWWDIRIGLIQVIVKGLNGIGKKSGESKGTENKMGSKTIKKALGLNDGMLDVERDLNVRKSERGATKCLGWTRC